MTIICDPQNGCGFVILPEVCVDVLPIIEVEFSAGPCTRFTPLATSVKMSTVKMAVSKTTNKLYVFLIGQAKLTHSRLCPGE